MRIAKFVGKTRKLYNQMKHALTIYSYLFCRKPMTLRHWKGQIHFITFGSQRFKLHLDRIFREAKTSEFFDTITLFTEEDLPEVYKKQYSINETVRGFGYWRWKSYITRIKLREIAMGDILIYLDAGCSINKQGKKRYFEYVNLLLNSEHSSLSFLTIFSEKTYTKEDLFQYFELDPDSPVRESPQLSCCPVLIKKDKNGIRLIDQWFSICHSETELIDDSPSRCLNDGQFIEHRHDQSVFSLLRKLSGTIIITNELWREKRNLPFNIHRFK